MNSKNRNIIAWLSLFAMALLGSLLLSAEPLAAQTVPAPTALTQDGWTYQITAGYANLSSAATNNGYIATVVRRLTERVSVRTDMVQTAAPVARLFLIGPEYQFPLAKLLKSTPYLDTSKFGLFIHAGGGTGQAGLITTNAPYKFAVAVGGGITYYPGGSFFIRPLDVSFVHSPVFAPKRVLVIGNQLQLAAQLGFNF